MSKNLSRLWGWSTALFTDLIKIPDKNTKEQNKGSKAIAENYVMGSGKYHRNPVILNSD